MSTFNTNHFNRMMGLIEIVALLMGLFVPAPAAEQENNHGRWAKNLPSDTRGFRC